MRTLHSPIICLVQFRYNVIESTFPSSFPFSFTSILPPSHTSSLSSFYHPSFVYLFYPSIIFHDFRPSYLPCSFFLPPSILSSLPSFPSPKSFLFFLKQPALLFPFHPSFLPFYFSSLISSSLHLSPFHLYFLPPHLPPLFFLFSPFPSSQFHCTHLPCYFLPPSLPISPFILPYTHPFPSFALPASRVHGFALSLNVF